MPKADIVDLTNKKVGSIELADEVFAVEVSEALIYQAVHHYQACRRAGTHKVKGRGEVSGSGRKPWKQKGTGRARVGSIRSPLWRHGGTVHGPQPRSYAYHLPRKMQLGALRSALTARFNDGAIKIVREFVVESHKTRDFVEALGKLGASEKVLLIENAENRNLELSSRNIPGVTLIRSRELHPYHLLDAETIVFSEPAAQHCSEVLA